MGRKINPLVFRSNLRYKKTNWVSPYNQYRDSLIIDNKIKKFIFSFAKKKHILINNIKIYKKQTIINNICSSLYIEIYILKNKFKKEVTTNEIFKIKKKLKQYYLLNDKLSELNIKFINVNTKQKIQENFFNLINNIKKGISINLLFSSFLKELIKIKKITGIKLSLKGRIKGAEKSRYLISRWGTLYYQKILSKLHILKENIYTKDGVLNLILQYTLK